MTTLEQITLAASWEAWKPIRGFEGKYEVSNLGKVRSLDTFTTNQFGVKSLRKGKVLKGGLTCKSNPPQYRSITLINCDKKTCHRIHRLVAGAFLPNPDSLPCVLHKNGNPLNNKVTNLYWGTHKDNARDRGNHGGNIGEKNPNSRIKEIDAKMIKEFQKDGHGVTSISKMLSLKYTTVRAVCEGRTWKHIIF